MNTEESATTVGMAKLLVQHLDGVGADDFALAEEVFELEAGLVISTATRSLSVQGIGLEFDALIFL